MADLFTFMLIALYFFTAGCLMLYGLNCYVMVFLFKRGRTSAQEYRRKVRSGSGKEIDHRVLPFVTTQIPIYNEFNVSERVLRAVCRIKYPAGKHEIQVLDDSTDETAQLIDEVVSELQKAGHHIYTIRRKNRVGFKAGALAGGLEQAIGELVAVFDADFVPPENFLMDTAPFFMADKHLGLAQARWGHLNRKRSLLTRAQSMGIDGHFMVEQSARNWSNLFMNFNGTAGIWRKEAIMDGGGWQWDTLTEDMDLSYRVQFAGWDTIYLPDLVVPAEIPEDVRAFKNQQFRWAKGSIQTAKKLLPGLLRSSVPLFKKIEAVFHLTHYFVHPMMTLLALLALPVLFLFQANPGYFVFTVLAIILGISMAAPSMLYIVSQRAAYRNWLSRIIYLPFLVVIGVGIAISNSRAVFEAIAGYESEFVRTPKKGDREMKSYRVRLPWSAVFEILTGVYCAWSLGYYFAAGKYFIGPFLAAYSAGFLFIGLLSLVHATGISE